jgi:elongator complex protein 3
VRSREIGAGRVEAAALLLRELAYASADGEECFLEYATPEGRLVAFPRLSLPRSPAPLPELAGRALVREVHVYGASLEIGRRGGPAAQHLGLGRRLLARAAQMARERGYPGLAVISAVGTRAYYRGLGFRDGAFYQHLEL